MHKLYESAVVYNPKIDCIFLHSFFVFAYPWDVRIFPGTLRLVVVWILQGRFLVDCMPGGLDLEGDTADTLPLRTRMLRPKE
jgi:hypothetical protein